jgi:ubiquinone/menaquinone biosynthesis C-methylase UbiE
VASLGPVKQYYDARATEYDEWYLGQGRFERLDRPNWHRAVAALERSVAELSPAKTLDVACGTGFLTRHLRGEVTGLDQSTRMLEVARKQAPAATFVVGDALELPFDDQAFERVFTGHFYGHLEQAERTRFLAEARRVSNELVVVDSAVRDDHEREELQTRILNDGSHHQVFKRYFEGPELAQELGGGRVVHKSRYFVLICN